MRPLNIAFTVGLIVGASIISMSVLAFTAYVTANYPDISTNQLIQYSRSSKQDHPFWTTEDQQLMDQLNRELIEEVNKEHQIWLEKQKPSQP